MTIVEIADSLDTGGDTHDCGHDHGTGQNTSQTTAQTGQSTEQCIEDYDHMRYERYRLETFRTWPQSANADKNQLAANGFYYIGDDNDDRVQCDFCKIILKKWEPGDVVQEEHRKHGPLCPYVKDPAHAGNFPLGFRSFDSTHRHYHGPRHLEYQDRRIRFESFHNWPINKKRRPTPGELANAGFFYLGQGDCVKCFYCGGMLRHWEETDDVWAEHMKWFPLCLFVVEHDPSCHGEIGRHLQRTISGIALSNGYSDEEITGYRQYIEDSQLPHPEEYREFVNELDQYRHRQVQISVSSVASNATVTSEVNPQHAASRTNVEDQNERYLCKVCYKNPLEVIFYPCKHVCCCQECGDKLPECPVCRTNIRGKLQLFFP
ncbi:baculoviral IAP repeat-containing protein 7-A-like isoform X1 [Mytilus californianus]|uniref:baculoviral IAP repeat-containing protein 7-A-like isoform X1 n=1 Tax=Mytilus californianus TaxID=6549 RepID=UPI0022470CA1|nr:baculoviral IAP repeat-containing protein 7-A-like isoform X1 [Mytilus californianus]